MPRLIQSIIYLLYIVLHNLILSRQPPLFQGTAAVILLFLQGLYFETAPVGAVMSLCMAAQIACDHDCCGQL